MPIYTQQTAAERLASEQAATEARARRLAITRVLEFQAQFQGRPHLKAQLACRLRERAHLDRTIAALQAQVDATAPPDAAVC